MTSRDKYCLPLFKGRNDTSSYRTISLCVCLGILLEKVVSSQLTAYLNTHNLLQHGQYGFIAGRSTVTNLEQFGAFIADITSRGHAYDIISVDFKNAFDKAQHHHVLAALSCLGICGTALEWFASFLSSHRTENLLLFQAIYPDMQQLRVKNDLSDPRRVTSGVVQGSTLGPPLFTALTDSLLHQIAFPADALYICSLLSLGYP